MEFFSLQSFDQSQHPSFILYPQLTPSLYYTRLDELKEIGIEGFYSYGEKQIKKFYVLGIGYCGVVILGRWNGEQVAVKLHRTDTDREGLEAEGNHIKLANSINLGPKLFYQSKDILVMEYLRGERLIDWIMRVSGLEEDKKLTKQVIGNIFRDCYRMDSFGLDHGDLSCVWSHIMIWNDKATFLDFSSSSTDRRSANLTSVVQSLFLGSRLPEHLSKSFKMPSKGDLIQVLRTYKHDPTQKNFDALFTLLDLHSLSDS